MKIQTVNPFTEEVLNEYTITARPQIDAKINEATKAQETWREVELEGRIKLMKRLGRRILAKKDALAATITEEMGKPISEAAAEAEKCALLCSYFANRAKHFLKEEEVKTDYQRSYVTFEPLGVVGGIMPWNFPMWQAMRLVVPAVTAGNAVLLKPSSVTIKSGGLQLGELFEKTRFPENVFQTVVGDGATGQALAEASIDAISFTGSYEAGQKVAYTAMKSIKKIVLELGGSDPFIVFEDADIEKAAAAAVAGRFVNSGQSCIAAKRIILMKPIATAFSEKFIEGAKQLVVGDPTSPDTDIGPMAREEYRKRVEEQVNQTVAAGAKILLQGGRQEGKGYFYRPVILGEAKSDSPVMTEEVFGPAVPIVIVETEAEAINAANGTQYGLGASVWTNSEKGAEIAKRIRCGVVYVNDTVRSDPRFPFGGVKKSGTGRELSRYGLLEMVNVRTTVIH